MSPPRLRPHHLLALLPTLLLPTAVPAQTVTLINYAALPSCASSCTDLTTAQAGCVPPAAAVTNQQTYTSCFCQSAFLSSLYSTGNTVCNAACPDAADQQKIQQWYVGFCRDGTGGVSSSAGVTSATAATSSAAATATATGTVTGAVSSNGGSSDYGEQGSWISTHYKWIVMLAVIFIAMLAIFVLGLYFKRRQRRLQDIKRANLAAPNAYIAPVPQPPQMRNNPNASNMSLPNSIRSAGRAKYGHNAGSMSTSSVNAYRSPLNSYSDAVVWGPHQHMAASRGYAYASPPRTSQSMAGLMSVPSPVGTPVGNKAAGGGKGKAREVIQEVSEDGGKPLEEHPAFRAERTGTETGKAKAGLRGKLSKR